MFTGKEAPPEMPIVIDHIALKDILGPPVFEMEVIFLGTQFPKTVSSEMESTGGEKLININAAAAVDKYRNTSAPDLYYRQSNVKALSHLF